MLCDDLDGWDGGGGGGREVQEGGDICIHIADSLRCTAETNITLQSNYSPCKKKKNRKKKAVISIKSSSLPIKF